jgi:CheY-like chemotaxis protein
MKNVLIVDDEKKFLISLSEGLIACMEGINILTAENGRNALEVMKSAHVGLVVTDLRMPVMDGFELLAHMSKHYPKVPVIVMTAFGSPEVGSRLKSTGINQYIDKPLDYRDLAVRILEGLEADSRGYFHGITLLNFLKLVEMEKKTCSLKIMSKKKAGYLVFIQGCLQDAHTGDLTGLAAAREIMSWEEPWIEIDTISRMKEKEKDRVRYMLSEIVSGLSSQARRRLGFTSSALDEYDV